MLRTHSCSLGRDLAARAAAPILLNDLVGLQRLLAETLANNPDLRYAFVLNDEGRVLVHTFGEGFPLALLEANRAEAQEHHHTVLLQTEEGLVGYRRANSRWPRGGDAGGRLGCRAAGFDRRRQRANFANDGAYLGAAGYVLKKAADAELISAIRAVLRGEMYVHPSMTRALLDEMLPKAEAAPDAWETLSEREREVLRLVALGHTSAEIAAQLHLSDKTVETYRARGMEKLGLPNRAALVRFALKKGILGEG